MLDAALDLFLGSRCVGWGVPGRMLCRCCWSSLPDAPRVRWPVPSPPDLVTPWSLAPYDGVVLELVVGHKDHGQLGHRHTLGALLALPVLGAVADLEPAVPVLLVPVPSGPGAARRRGYDPMAAIVAATAHRLGREREVRTAKVLASRGGVADQAGLGATARAVNVTRSMSCPAHPFVGCAGSDRSTSWSVTMS